MSAQDAVMTPRQAPAPVRRPQRRLAFVAAVLTLAPAVAALHGLGAGALRSLPAVPAPDLIGDTIWLLQDPGRLFDRVLALTLVRSGAPSLGVPFFGVLAAALVLMLAVTPWSPLRGSGRRQFAAAAALALTPGYLMATATADPLLAGLVAWAIVVRAMAQCEGRDNIQQEMTVACGLCLLLLAEPQAWVLIAGVVAGLPLLYRNTHHRSELAAMALSTTPLVMTVLVVVISLSLLTGTTVTAHMVRWTGAATPLGGDRFGVETQAAGLWHVLLVCLPVVVNLVLALRQRHRRHHPVTLVLGAGLPALAAALLAATGCDAAFGAVSVYATTGLVIWMGRTVLAWNLVRWGMAALWLATVGLHLL